MFFLVVAKKRSATNTCRTLYHSKKHSSNNTNTARYDFSSNGKKTRCDKYMSYTIMASVFNQAKNLDEQSRPGTAAVRGTHKSTSTSINSNKQHKHSKATGNSDRATVKQEQQRTQQQGRRRAQSNS